MITYNLSFVSLNRYDFITGKVDKYHWIDVGSSYVPSEVSCAVLYAQLEECVAITARRVQHFNTYTKYFAKWAERGSFSMPRIPDQCTTNAHIFFVLLRNEDDKLFYETELKKKGISAFAHYCPLHSAPAGLKYGRVGSDMTVTDSIHGSLLRLPIWIGMGAEEVKHVIKSVRLVAAVRDSMISSNGGGDSLSSAVESEDADVMCEFNRV